MKLHEKESNIQKSILDWLQYNGIFAFRSNVIGVPLPQGGFRPSPIRGVSDIIGVIPRKKGFGIPLFIEVKSKNGKISDNQARFLGDAEYAGAIAFVARSLDDVIEKVKPYLNS